MSGIELKIIKQDWNAKGDVCLFVTHSPDCTVKPHVAHHVAALMNAGFQVILIAATDRLAVANRLKSFNAPAGLIARSNRGYDFGAWADTLRAMPDLWDASRLLLVNDSVIGPTRKGPDLFLRLKQSTADLVGLVESYQYARHLQSFFLLMNRPALAHTALRDFWSGVENLVDKSHVIRNYEVRFTSVCRDAGLNVQSLYPYDLFASKGRAFNPTIELWSDLLRRGFPYVKVQLIRDFLPPPNILMLKQILSEPVLNPFIDWAAKQRQAG